MTVLCLWLAAALQAEPAEAPQPSSGASSTSQLKGADLQLLEEVRRIAGKVESVRGEKFARPPLALRVHHDFLRVTAEARARSVLPIEQLEARERAWRDLGLAASPEKLLAVLAADLVDIGFDPGANRLLVTDKRLSGEEFAPSEGEPSEPATVLMMTGMRPDEPLVAHLLIHVRQRERDGRDYLATSTDRLLANAAWAEGEANLVAVRYLFHEMGIGDDALAHSVDPGGLLEGELLPAFGDGWSASELGLLDFAYREGFFQAVQRYMGGGWPAVRRALEGPRTTHAVLHSERPASTPVAFPAAVSPVKGLQLADEDSLGEQGIIVLVSQLTDKDNLGLLAGAGWNGDALRRWEGGAGVSITEWLTRWENEATMRDFLYGLERGLGTRCEGAKFVPAAGGARECLAEGVLYEIFVEPTAVRVRVVSPSLVAAYRSATAAVRGETVPSSH